MNSPDFRKYNIRVILTSDISEKDLKAALAKYEIDGDKPNPRLV